MLELHTICFLTALLSVMPSKVCCSRSRNQRRSPYFIRDHLLLLLLQTLTAYNERPEDIEKETLTPAVVWALGHNAHKAEYVEKMVLEQVFDVRTAPYINYVSSIFSASLTRSSLSLTLALSVDALPTGPPPKEVMLGGPNDQPPGRLGHCCLKLFGPLGL